MADEPVKLGEKYIDNISGFEGVAVARFEYLYGCVRVQIEAILNGEPKDFVFDEQRLTRAPSAKSGGARPDPASRGTGARRIATGGDHSR
jgi:hypothetical protein